LDFCKLRIQFRLVVQSLCLALLSLLVLGCAHKNTGIEEESFTIVMLPDTQNMVHFQRQKAEGFAIDSSEIFAKHMQYIADNAVSNGGDVVFVASVGDVWQHGTSNSDPGHVARGVWPEPDIVHRNVNRDGTLNIEIPAAKEGFTTLSNAGIPFGVAPGNHDYDAWWQVAGSELGANGRYAAHIGGLDNFRMVFGSDSQFFKDKDWYVASFRGGANSAQIFSGGGFRFLHLALEMHSGPEVFAWAESVVADHPGLPTIVTTHDYMDARGEREYPGMDLVSVDPEYHNSTADLWEKFVRTTDQIFMVLCGHKGGQALRIDNNDYGHAVYQILADYQDRGQAGLDAGQPLERDGGISGIGDGWLREMVFHISDDKPRIDIKTYSTHYGVHSSELSTYAEWYKADEQPDMTDEQFLDADEFTIELSDFHERFEQIQ
jgi:hypothetical protein